MSEVALTNLQRLSLHILNESILSPERLRQGCPLKMHDGSDLFVNHDLGTLGRLPAELRYRVLSSVDLASLFVFRRVSRCALVTVNHVVEFQKVMSHAADSIRMGFAIKTAHSFSISQLFAKLCQKHCDGEKCGNYAPYIDVFTLTRRCLSTGGGCPIPLGPTSKDLLQQFNFVFPDDFDLPAHRFYAIPGTYSEIFSTDFEQNSCDDHVFYDYCKVRELLNSANNASRIAICDRIGSKDDTYWALCSTTAPRLNTLGSSAEYGVFCDVCKHSRSDEIDGDVPESISEGQDESKPNFGHWVVDHPDPRMMTFMTVEAFEKHMEEEHEGLEVKKT